ncbi:hypothetical protein [Phaeospirillum tilakii]|uniref:Glycosyl transferase family 2 n=1 Tax=Phaeospirillum tilakii TaxID=741673 RepID=A0ABW5C8X3_9PROT
MNAFAQQFRQEPSDVAVVIPTVLRETLTRAVHSVFDQDLDGRIQILIGIDAVHGPAEQLAGLMESCPDNVTLTIVDPGYSTARRNGGVHACGYGGSLRAALSFLANSRHVAYLDDDNWFAPNHLSSLRKTITGVDWAYSRRWMVDPRTDGVICVDTWESVGPNAGVYAKRFGGFVDTSSLMIDKLKCLDVLPCWSDPPTPRGNCEDRMVFFALTSRYKGAGTGEATSFYTVDADDVLQKTREEFFRRAGYDWAAMPAPTPAPSRRGNVAPARQRAVGSLIALAGRYESEGKRAVAVDLLGRILDAAPGDRLALRYMEEMCARLGHAEDARAVARERSNLDAGASFTPRAAEPAAAPALS